MSISTILTKAGLINPCERQTGTQNLYDIEFQENSDIDSLLSYYSLTQKTRKIIDAEQEFDQKSNLEKVQEIKSMAENVKYGGNPLYIGWTQYTENKEVESGYSSSSHAIVGYGYETGNYNYDGKEFNGRILIYDSNSVEFRDDCCLYINDRTGDWTIPAYDGLNSYEDNTFPLLPFLGKEQFSYLNIGTNDVDLLNVSDMSSTISNVYSQFIAQGKLPESIIVAGKQYNMKDIIRGKYRSEGVTPTTSFIGANNNSGIGAGFSSSDNCTVKPEKQNTEFDYTMDYSDAYICASGDGTAQVDFTNQGNVSLKDNTGDFLLSSTVNNNGLRYANIKVSGNETVNPSLVRNEQGYIFSGDNISNVTITTDALNVYNNRTDSITITTDEEEVLVKMDEEEIKALVDTNDDGIFETELSDTTGIVNNTTNTEPVSSPSTGDNQIFVVVAFSVTVLLVAGVLITYLRFRRTRI